MRTSLFIDGEFAPYGPNALVEIQQDGKESTFCVTLDQPEPGSELVNYRIPLEEVVRLAIEHAVQKIEYEEIPY